MDILSIKRISLVFLRKIYLRFLLILVKIKEILRFLLLLSFLLFLLKHFLSFLLPHSDIIVGLFAFNWQRTFEGSSILGMNGDRYVLFGLIFISLTFNIILWRGHQSVRVRAFFGRSEIIDLKPNVLRGVLEGERGSLEMSLDTGISEIIRPDHDIGGFFQGRIRLGCNISSDTI